MSSPSTSHDTTALLAAGAFLYLSLTLLTRSINYIVPPPVPRADGYWWTYRDVATEFTAIGSADGAPPTDASAAQRSTSPDRLVRHATIRMRDKHGRKLPTQDQIPLDVLETLLQSPVYDIRRIAVLILGRRYALHPHTASNFRKSWTAQQSSWDVLEPQMRLDQGVTIVGASSANSAALEPNDRELLLCTLLWLDPPALRLRLRALLPDIFGERNPSLRHTNAPSPVEIDFEDEHDRLRVGRPFVTYVEAHHSAMEAERMRRCRIAAYERFVAAIDPAHRDYLLQHEALQILGYNEEGQMRSHSSGQLFRHDALSDPDEQYIRHAIRVAATIIRGRLHRTDPIAPINPANDAEPPSMFEGIEGRQTTNVMQSIEGRPTAESRHITEARQTIDGIQINEGLQTIDGVPLHILAAQRTASGTTTPAQTPASRVVDEPVDESTRRRNRAALSALMGETLARRVAGRMGPNISASASSRGSLRRDRRARANESAGGRLFFRDEDAEDDGGQLGRRVARAERSGADGRGSRAVSPRAARLGSIAAAGAPTSLQIDASPGEGVAADGGEADSHESDEEHGDEDVGEEEEAEEDDEEARLRERRDTRRQRREAIAILEPAPESDGEP